MYKKSGDILEESTPMQGDHCCIVLGKEVLYILFVDNLPQTRYANFISQCGMDQRPLGRYTVKCIIISMTIYYRRYYISWHVNYMHLRFPLP